MKFQGQAVLVYLEEDNITKAYFRIRPLLTSEGPVSQEELNAFPDEGYLRIVPDKNEQHTFKERMRNMCGLCLLDLRNQPSDANKIRTNKNYSPTRGEVNQFIVYSDAVQAIPQNLMYQVVSEAELDKAVTPQVYIRSGANMQGPVEKGAAHQEAGQLAPDSKGIFSISLNNQELLFYWPQEETVSLPTLQEEEAVSAPPEEEKETALDKIQQMNNTCITETAHSLKKEAATPAFSAPKQPLSGTRLYQPPQKQTSFRRAHNPLMETVEQQRYAAKYEAPGAVLSDCSALKDVANPAEDLKRCLHDMCSKLNGNRQAVESLLSCPGMRQTVIEVMGDSKNDLTFTAMHRQLQELEAERLMLLMQLSDARKDKQAFRQEAIGEMTHEEKKAVEALRAQQKALTSEIEKQKTELMAFDEKRTEAEETLQNAAQAKNEFIVRKTGSDVPTAELVNRLEKALQTVGFVCEEDDALAMLTAYALSPATLLFDAPSVPDAALAIEAMAAVFCAPISTIESCTIMPGGNTPVFSHFQMHNHSTLALTGETYKMLYPFALKKSPCPMLHFVVNQTAIPGDMPVFPAVSQKSLDAFLTEGKLSDETIAAVNSLRHCVPALPLPLVIVKNMLRFIAATQNRFKGGVAESIDRAFAMFALPYFMDNNAEKDTLLPQLAALPCSMELLNSKK